MRRFYDLKIKTPSDFVRKQSYSLRGNFGVSGISGNIKYFGDFVIQNSGTSQCCKEENGHIRIKKIIIPR
jgi:hypothetical protein